MADKTDILAMLMNAPVGFLNGAKAFGEQAKWMMGGYGDAPMPAPYDGGLQYPAANDANAYVRENWPGDGRHLMHLTRPESFYTPPGFDVPKGGRGPTIGEDYNLGRANHTAMAAALRRILESR